MADLSITAANVTIGGTNTSTKPATAGATITGGQAVARLSSDQKWYPADADGASAEYAGAQEVGVAMTGAATDGFFTVATAGPYVAGATLTEGEFYIVSETAGGIAPVGDLSGFTSASYVTLIGQATSTSVIEIKANAYTGAQIA